VRQGGGGLLAVTDAGVDGAPLPLPQRAGGQTQNDREYKAMSPGSGGPAAAGGSALGGELVTTFGGATAGGDSVKKTADGPDYDDV